MLLYILSLSLSHTHTHTHTLSLSLSLSLAPLLRPLSFSCLCTVHPQRTDTDARTQTLSFWCCVAEICTLGVQGTPNTQTMEEDFEPPRKQRGEERGKVQMGRAKQNKGWQALQLRPISSFPFPFSFLSLILTLPFPEGQQKESK